MVQGADWDPVSSHCRLPVWSQRTFQPCGASVGTLCPPCRGGTPGRQCELWTPRSQRWGWSERRLVRIPGRASSPCKGPELGKEEGVPGPSERCGLLRVGWEA